MPVTQTLHDVGGANTAELGANWRLQFIQPDGLPLTMAGLEVIDFGAISYKEIFQNVKTIMATPLYSAALERTLGLDQTIVDTPITAAGQITVAILDAVTTWESRHHVRNIDFEADPINGHLVALLQLDIQNVIYGTNTPYTASNIFPIPTKVTQELPPMNVPVPGPPGPAGAPATIPDPLVIGTLQAGTQVYIGAKMRIVGMANGGRIEVQDGTGAWIVQAQWTQ
jgi:phage baseplate assembly protein W